MYGTDPKKFMEQLPNEDHVMQVSRADEYDFNDDDMSALRMQELSVTK